MANSKVNPSKIIFRVPTLLSLVSQFIIDYEEINNTLNPEEDWDVDNSHLYNQRLNHLEVWAFEAEVLSAVKPLAEVKRDIRAVLLQRPFDLDLIQLQAIPLFENLPEVIARDIWIEAFLVQFEAQLHWSIDFNPKYRKTFTWNELNCLMDCCRDKNLLKKLKEQEDILVVNELVSEWLLDNLHIDQ